MVVPHLPTDKAAYYDHGLDYLTLLNMYLRQIEEKQNQWSEKRCISLAAQHERVWQVINELLKEMNSLGHAEEFAEAERDPRLSELYTGLLNEYLSFIVLYPIEG